MRAILHDVARCKGCMKCVEICLQDNDLVHRPGDRMFEPEPLSAHRFTTLERTKNDHFVRKHCLHCVEPACAAACLVGALHQTPEGPVVYDATKCIGCRYCMLACPFQAVKYEWEKALPFVKKCDMCYDRPGGPACVEACPHDATVFGERKDLIKEARRRIDARPDLYVDHIWGEHELGGTGVMFIAPESLDDRWPGSLGGSSIPDITTPLTQKTPYIAFGVLGFLTATSWVIGRRNRLAEERASEDASVETEESDRAS
jgi:formate dehydrogenase iron-sulfur subunit